MREKKLLLTLGVVFSGIILFSVLSFFNNSKKTATLTTEVAPSGAIVKLSGKGISNGNHKLHHGNYTLVVSREGFETQKTEITLKHHEEKYVGVVLEPNSAETSNWYINNDTERVKADGIISKSFDQKNSEQADNSPLFRYLPVSWNHGLSSINIGPSPRDNKRTAVIIQETTTIGRQSMIQWIRDQGYKPGDYEIDFPDYVNPIFED